MLRLKEFRLELGLTQNQFGEKIGICGHNIGDWERGNGAPSIEWLVTIANTFDVSIDYLVGRTEDTMHASVGAGVPELKPEERTLLFNYSRLTKSEKLSIEMLIDSFMKDKTALENVQEKIDVTSK